MTTMIYGTQAYAQVGLQSSVMSASPHKLITMLFEGAISSLVRAGIHIQQKETSAKGKAITKAVNIISNGLLASLDREKGGEISDNLAALYDYMIRRLLHANRYNDEQAIQEVLGLLRGIADSWKQISPDTANTDQTV
ncbi:flagellar export chaperone FliS [Brenneria tiliae]|uniref:flagellar export chaperone FliS n=1 Tax=Brenneria tiliae TaxID=2914984 RepID=UPI0020149E2C|nr:flagellar export chaperone FliS [Brenneria tiliae]MCL2899843.1 flagellar export chaperone FliS [Brenneria tiliae]MCL2904668.1 flagellar export chaperone FliS [Brenneria tiliae]